MVIVLLFALVYITALHLAISIVSFVTIAVVSSLIVVTCGVCNAVIWCIVTFVNVSASYIRITLISLPAKETFSDTLTNDIMFQDILAGAVVAAVSVDAVRVLFAIGMPIPLLAFVLVKAFHLGISFEPIRTRAVVPSLQVK